MRIRIPRKLEFLNTPSRYKVAYGGRGGAKSWNFARTLLIKGMMQPLRILCAREIQISINDSVKALLDDTIDALGINEFYRSIKTEIVGLNGTRIIFAGLRHNATKIKSMEGVDICWIEEANTVSKESLDLLFPTIRKENSEIWFSFNPKLKTEPVYNMFVANHHPDAIVQKINYYDNPFLPDVLRKEMEWDKSHDIDKYKYVWEGELLEITDAQVFKGKWSVDRFHTPDGVVFYYGSDWGFSKDPTTLIRCYFDEEHRKIFIDYEAYGIGVELDEIPQLFSSVPGARDWPITADSSRPETISHVSAKGFNIRPSRKGAGSIEDGIAFLKSYDIIIHERCKHTIDEFFLYSYKEDRMTGDILPIIIDKNNHMIDALRYAVENYKKAVSKLDIFTGGTMLSNQAG